MAVILNSDEENTCCVSGMIAFGALVCFIVAIYFMTQYVSTLLACTPVALYPAAGVDPPTSRRQVILGAACCRPASLR